jgi:AcrR family transcriptional regulator
LSPLWVIWGIFPVQPTIRSPAKELGPRANRTIARILEATKSVFLSRGYAGTSIDEITRVAGVSRGSFYTYFPSKRDALLALGADSMRAGRRAVEHLQALPDGWTEADLEAFVAGYFEMLDEHGSFALAWTQAAQEDEEIRQAGMKRHLELCREMGYAVESLRGERLDDPTAHGLVIHGLLERSWSYGGLYDDTISAESVRRAITHVLAALLGDPRSRS